MLGSLHRTLRVVVLARLTVFAGLVVLLSCGVDDGRKSSPDGEPPPGDLLVIEENNQFELSYGSVSPGVEVTVVAENRDRLTSHNIHFPTLDGSPRTRLENGPGYQTLTVVFPAAGTYPFVCDIHATMRGSLTVPYALESPDSADSPG